MLEGPVFNSVPACVTDSMKEIDPVDHAKLYPKGSIVFLYDGPDDGESTAAELLKMEPWLKGRIFAFDLSRSENCSYERAFSAYCILLVCMELTCSR